MYFFYPGMHFFYSCRDVGLPRLTPLQDRLVKLTPLVAETVQAFTVMV
jgi:hypothetical protein